MNILEINCTDLVGQAFNGYDLHKSLIEKGINANQLVLKKQSKEQSVEEYGEDDIFALQLRSWEKIQSINHLIFPYGKRIYEMDLFQNADVVHYHILSEANLSLFDYPLLFNSKPSVWTVHNYWGLTGNCIYPFLFSSRPSEVGNGTGLTGNCIQPILCDKWEKECINCSEYNQHHDKMYVDNVNFMWKVKKKIFEKVNPHIVVSTNKMKEMVQKSPITSHLKNISVIPFGVRLDDYDVNLREVIRNKYHVQKDEVVIGFRTANLEEKGCRYIYEALEGIRTNSRIKIFCVGTGEVPKELKQKYDLIELGWISDRKNLIEFLELIDIFLMPSLEETFGVMAIEALAAECTVICFEGTTVEEITRAPECGISVKFASSEALKEEIERLIVHPQEIKWRGKKGREIIEQYYTYEQYVDKHAQLYENLMHEAKDINSENI